jgi:hypothetical protein
MAATPEAPERSTETTASPIDSHAAPVADRRGHSGRATAAMVLGIVGLPLAVLFWPASLVLAILAIVLGSLARSDARRDGATNTGQAKAGIILGIVDLVAIVAWIALVATVISNNN